MRWMLRVFALLDVVSILLLASPFWQIITHLNQIPNQFLSQLNVYLTIPLFISLFVSAAGLFLIKRFGFITYYIQFLVRLLIWVFSIGFITYIPEFFNLSERWFDILFKLCYVAEFFRLYFTIKIDRSKISL